MTRRPLQIGEHGEFTAHRSATGWTVHARVKLGDGTRRQRQATGRTLGEAKRLFEEDLAIEIGKRPARLRRASMTVQQLLDEWLVHETELIDHSKRGALRQQTLTEYRRLAQLDVITASANRHLPRAQHITNIGTRRLDEITAGDIHDFVSTMNTVWAVQGSQIHTVLSKAYAYGRAHSLLHDNPMVGLRVPKRAAKPVRALRAEQIPELLALVDERTPKRSRTSSRAHQLGTIVRVDLGLALREGETLALRWSDISGLWDENRTDVTIAGTIVSPFGGAYTYQPATKTRSSERTITAPRWVVEIIRSQWALTGEKTFVFAGLRRAAGKKRAARDGEFITPTALNAWLREALTDTPYEGVTMHRLRKTTATLLLANGVDIYAVSRLLGHASVNITQKSYIDTRIAQPDLSNALDRLFE